MPVTPVMTSSESNPALCAPSMSVSSDSPTMEPIAATRRTVSSSNGRSGAGHDRRYPGEPCERLHEDAVPWSTPNRVGIVRSALLANHGSPSRTRTRDAHMMSRHSTSGP